MAARVERRILFMVSPNQALTLCRRKEASAYTSFIRFTTPDIDPRRIVERIFAAYAHSPEQVKKDGRDHDQGGRREEIEVGTSLFIRRRIPMSYTCPIRSRAVI